MSDDDRDLLRRRTLLHLGDSLRRYAEEDGTTVSRCRQCDLGEVVREPLTYEVDGTTCCSACGRRVLTRPATPPLLSVVTFTGRRGGRSDLAAFDESTGSLRLAPPLAPRLAFAEGQVIQYGSQRLVVDEVLPPTEDEPGVTRLRMHVEENQ